MGEFLQRMRELGEQALLDEKLEKQRKVQEAEEIRQRHNQNLINAARNALTKLTGIDSDNIGTWEIDYNKRVRMALGDPANKAHKSTYQGIAGGLSYYETFTWDYHKSKNVPAGYRLFFIANDSYSTETAIKDEIHLAKLITAELKREEERQKKIRLRKY